MAQENSGCVSGGGLFLALIALGFVLAYWQFFLASAVLAAVVGTVVYVAAQQQHLQLRSAVEKADRRFRLDTCKVQDQFGVIQAITLVGGLESAKIEVLCRTIAVIDGQLQADHSTTSLMPPANRLQLKTATGIAEWLNPAGIIMLAELSVEAKAVKAAMECLKEAEWTTGALAKLSGLKDSVIDTLKKAPGNELLESAIPQLKEALAAFEAEERKLLQAKQSSTSLLRKLHDFLTVPDGIRPILTFELDQLFDPQRFSELEQSFSDVVLLNDTFRELSRDALD